jgi:hypothetical protein
MQVLDHLFPGCAFFLFLAGCGGQTLSPNPADSGASDARQDDDSATVGPNDATPQQVEDAAGTSSVGSSDAMPVALDASLSASGCLSICEAKAAACGAPSGAAAMDCQAMCAESPTSEQLACIQTRTCSSLAAAFEDAGTVCGIGQLDGG